MKQLLEGRFAPLSDSIGFLAAPLDDCAKAFVRGRRERSPAARCTELYGPLEELLPRLAPLHSSHNRELLIETSSEWTALFDNSGDPISGASALAGRLSCQALAVTCFQQFVPGEGPAAKRVYSSVQFHIFAPGSDRPLNQSRIIEVLNDGGQWQFHASGEIQPFEQPGRYSAHRVRDRFTAAMLEDYAEAMGIRVFDSSFYGPRAVLVERPVPRGAEAGLTLDEARRTLGLPETTH